MRWSLWSSKSKALQDHQQEELEQEQHSKDEPQSTSISFWSSSKTNDPKKPAQIIDWAAFIEPRTLSSTAILTTCILGAVHLHRRYLMRFSNAVSISPSYFRRRSILGRVTSVGDGDNFRIYHTPGGRVFGWGWLPWKKIPTSRKELKDKTVHVRLAGIDAPELAHFGSPEQPFARDAHQWLTSYLINRSVRVYVHRQDQYQRVVATVFVRRMLDFPIPFRRRDVSYEMLKQGLATVYEAKAGAEFGGPVMEERYRKAEWWAKVRRKGLWKDFYRNKEWESPRDYKIRMGSQDRPKGNGRKK